jgi:hypothetical protein
MREKVLREKWMSVHSIWTGDAQIFASSQMLYQAELTVRMAFFAGLHHDKEDAAELQEKAVSIMKEIMGEHHHKTLKAVESLRLIREGLSGISSSSDGHKEPGEHPKGTGSVQDKVTVPTVGDDTAV